jgi:dihydroneopterin aldolase
MSNSLFAFLRDCHVELRVGVYEDEIRAPRALIINVEMTAANDERFNDLREKDMGRVVNYKPVYHFIQEELPKLGPIRLLETVAEQIIAFCFRDPLINKVRVRIEKPDVFEHASAGIEVVRKRPKIEA